jgi:hypothetical protein
MLVEVHGAALNDIDDELIMQAAFTDLLARLHDCLRLLRRKQSQLAIGQRLQAALDSTAMKSAIAVGNKYSTQRIYGVEGLAP